MIETLSPATSAIVATIACLISVIFFFSQRRYDKKLNCFHVFQIWNSSTMYSARDEVWVWIRENNEEEFGFSRNKMNQLDPDVSRSLGMIQHFAVDLRYLIEGNVVDKKLARSLFWHPSLLSWFEHFEAAYESGNFENNERYIRFYRQHMRPLRKLMDGF